MDASLTVGLLEGDPARAASFGTWFADAGHAVHRYQNSAELRRRVGNESVDLLVVDATLPDVSTGELLGWLRHSAYSRLPVIYVDGDASEQGIVEGLRAGADDYVAHPVRRGELFARIENMLRHAGFYGSGQVLKLEPAYVLDVTRRHASIDAGPVHLTDREFDLAAFLFRRVGHVVSRDTLLHQVWNLNGNVTTRTVDTHISRLRKKLALDGRHGWQLSAVYQHGYRLERA